MKHTTNDIAVMKAYGLSTKMSESDCVGELMRKYQELVNRKLTWRQILMGSFKEKEYKSFELFNKDWALVTAGPMDDYNTMVIGWGELGTIWGHPFKGRSIVTVFVHPARYTSEFLKKYDTFTVSFYDKKYMKALGYLGSHSGRDGDKVAASGLTPAAIGDGVTFKEARLTFFCRKIYLHQLSKEGLAQEIKDYYAADPKSYPNVTPDGTDDNWEPHYAIIGEIIESREESSL